MIEASCHCSAVRLAIESAPSEVTECNCSICRRYGVLWAYYPLRSVKVVARATDTYRWDDESLVFHRCTTCGCVSHWSAVDPARDRIGVNARLLPPGSLVGVRVRHLDGAATGEYLD